jgi:hypothetical protein
MVKKPNSRLMNQVFQTKTYEMFKFREDNRQVKNRHVSKLTEKMLSKGWIKGSYVVINEKGEIIDGQHRFEVISELKLPLHYVICQGYGLDHVHRFNQISKTWNADDYMNGYCELGYEDYISYRDFKNKYQIGHNECMLLLSGTGSTKNAGNFNSGLLKIKSMKEAKTIIEKILLLQPYYDGFKRRTFIYCMYGLMKNQNFEFTEFIQKLKIQPTALQHCTDVEQYTALIEEIYNYKRRDKVNLRF